MIFLISGNTPAYQIVNAVKGAVAALKGGPGSGFHGHAGRPGQVGGSAPDGSTLYAKHGQPASITETLHVTDADITRDHHRILIDGEPIYIGSGMRYFPKVDGDMVDVKLRIIKGPADWLMKPALDIPEVRDAVDRTYAQLTTEMGGTFGEFTQTDAQDRIAALMHGYKSPLTYKARLDVLNAMTRAYLDGETVRVSHDLGRVDTLTKGLDKVRALVEEEEAAGQVVRELRSYLDRQPAEIFEAKLQALRMGQVTRDLTDQEAVNQFASEVQRTQADLRQRYGDTVTLYRGVQGDYAKAIKQGVRKKGATVEAAVYPASSWTSDLSIAQEFATKQGVVIKQNVPVERILFSYHTTPYIRLQDWAFGGTQESEFLIATPTDTLKIRKEDLV